MRLLNPKTVVKFLSYEKEEKKGYLWKRRSENKGSFKKRYFVLCGNILAYFEKLEKDPLGVIILEGHVVEMLDDLTMALRFPTIGEGLRSYCLRGDSVEDVEQWIRVLTRSGIDFFTLTLEDLEAQLNAVTVVRKSTQSTPSPVACDQQVTSVSMRASKRVNPFNRLTFYAANMADSTIEQTSTRNPQCPPKPSMAAPGAAIQCATKHLHWLLTQNWQQLHSRVKQQLAIRSVPPNSRDLIDLT